MCSALRNKFTGPCLLFRANVAVIFLAAFALAGCDKKQDSNSAPITTATPYTLVVPPGFPPPYINPENPMTVEGVQLGEMLYSDPILSSNGRSCSSCHERSKSYSLQLFVKSSGEL